MSSFLNKQSTNSNNSSNGNGNTIVNDKILSSESLKKATQLIFDIEDIIKNELDDLEKFISGDNNDVPFQRVMNKAKRKLEKRRGPVLIKPLNKKKSRIVLSNMEYDPISQIWKGNEKELNNFPSTPGLITQINPKNLNLSQHQMEWDAKDGQWRGNEADLSKFKGGMKPALITQLNGNLNMRTENGMVYDPVSQTWRGNEDDLDAFDAMDEQNKDNTFSVGKEFNLTTSLMQIFKACEGAHMKDLGGWYPEERKLDDKEYLFQIRNMSIMKLVQTAIYGTPGGSSNKGGNSIPPPSSPGGLIPLISNKAKVIDETKNWDDVDFLDEKPILKLNLKVHQDSSSTVQDPFGSGDNMSMTSGDDVSDWDKEMGFTSEDDTIGGGGSSINTPRLKDELSDNSLNDSLGGTNQNTSSSSLGKIIQLNKFKEKSQESEDDDEDDLDWDSYNKDTNSNNNNYNNNNNNINNMNNIKPSTSNGSIGIYNNRGTIKALENGGSLKIRGTMNTIPLSAIFSNNNNNNNSSNTPLSSSGSHKFGGGSIKSGGKPATSDDELETNSFYDDVEVPKGSILSLHTKNHIHNDDFNKLMLSGDEPHAETIKFFERVNDKDVVEEDWPEVQFSSKFTTTINNNSNNNSNSNTSNSNIGSKLNYELRKSPPVGKNQVEDYSEDIELFDSTKPLQLKKPVLLADNPFGEDSDDWSNDINFPVNFRPSTPSQQNHNINNNITNSSNKNQLNLTPTANYTASNSTIKPNSLFNTPSTTNNNKHTTTTTTTTTSSSTPTKKPTSNLNLTVPNSSPDDFRPLSPNSRNAALKTPDDNSPKTPFKYISRSKTDPIKMGLGADTL